VSLPATIVRGSGDVAVFLLHGVGGGKEAWQDNLEAIAAASCRAVAWDAPGYGASAPLARLDNAAFAHALVTLLDDVGAPVSVLCGHSMGGMIAQEVVARYPGRVQGLILSATSPAFGKPGGDWQREFLASRFAPLDAGIGMAGLAPTLARGMLAPGMSEAVVAHAAGIMARVPESTYRAALAAIVSFNRLAELPAIDVPTLCLAGEHDAVAPAKVMRRMAQTIPGAEFRILAGAGHIANMETPAAFNAAVVEFVQRRFM